MIGHIDRGSILYKMLESALKDFRPKVGLQAAEKGRPKVHQNVFTGIEKEVSPEIVHSRSD